MNLSFCDIASFNNDTFEKWWDESRDERYLRYNCKEGYFLHKKPGNNISWQKELTKPSSVVGLLGT